MNTRRWAALALVFNAFVWGVSWWPFRQLEALGLHPLWATAGVYGLAVMAILAARPRALSQVLRTPALWVVMLAAGMTNASFNWGVVIGDVVRVILLFYLMPLWAVLLARWLLGERLGRLAALRVALALGGAMTVIWPAEAGEGLPRSSLGLADVLGLLGGFSFALNNVMLRRESRSSQESRALAMFGGGALVSALLAGALASQGLAAWPPAPAAAWLAGTAALGAAFLLSNLSLQYGVTRLPAHVTAVVMLTEVPFAAGSALALGGGEFTPRLVLGGALILMAAALATLEPAEAAPAHARPPA